MPRGGEGIMDLVESYYNQLTSALEEWDKRDRVNRRKERLRKRFGEKYPHLKAKYYSKQCELCNFTAFNYRNWLHHLEENHKVWLFFHPAYKDLIKWELYGIDSRRFYSWENPDKPFFIC